MKNLTAAAGCLAALAALSLTAQTAPTNSAPSAAPAPSVSPAAAVPAAELTNPGLRDELLAMRDEDQAGRKQLIEHKDDADVRTKIQADDARHVARLREIIKQYGWPAKTMVGDKAGSAAWLIVQHGPKEFLAEMLPSMKAAADKGDLSRGLVATSEDRALVSEGKKQMYGTQFDTRDGKFEPFPIEDPERVDERRKSIGLGTLASYTEALKKTYHIVTPAASASASTVASSDSGKTAQSAGAPTAKQP